MFFQTWSSSMCFSLVFSCLSRHSVSGQKLYNCMLRCHTYLQELSIFFNLGILEVWKIHFFAKYLLLPRTDAPDSLKHTDIEDDWLGDQDSRLKNDSTALRRNNMLSMPCASTGPGIKAEFTVQFLSMDLLAGCSDFSMFQPEYVQLMDRETQMMQNAAPYCKISLLFMLKDHCINEVIAWVNKEFY